MRASTLAFVASIALGVQAQDFDDVPYQCRSVCSNIINTTSSCDIRFDEDNGTDDDSDTNFLNCVCNSRNARSLLTNCEACVTRYDNDGPDNDVRELVYSCGFSVQTTFSGPTATAMPTMTATGSMPTATWTDDDGPYDDYDDNYDGPYDDCDRYDDDGPYDDDYCPRPGNGGNYGNGNNAGSGSGSGSGYNGGSGSNSGPSSNNNNNNNGGNGDNAAAGMGVPVVGTSLFALMVVIAML